MTGFEYEKALERTARERQRELGKTPAKLKDKAPVADPRDLGSICAEAAFHLGNCYHCESRLQKGIKDDNHRLELETLVSDGRARFYELSEMAGRAIHAMRTKQPVGV